MPPLIAGVDFSGAAQAGRKIWVALAAPDDAALHVRAVHPAAELPGSGADRASALAALVAFLRGLGPCAAGLDFPFGLHRSRVPERTLAKFVAAFAARYPTPDAFRTAFASAAAGGERALKRRCDVEARTPFAPHNLRLYRQTWHGIAQVLAPLCAPGRARACLLPQEAPRPGRLWLLETCPASALKARGWYRPYKGHSAAHAAARRSLLHRLHGEGVTVPPRQRARLLEDAEGDALDSVLCAWIAWRACADPVRLRPPLAPEHRVEGYVYA